MYKKILVTLDGSELAEQALPHAEMLAREYKAQLYLLRVYEAEQALAVPATNFDTYHLVVSTEHTCRRAKAYLAQVKDQIEERVGDTTVLAVEKMGNVSETILAVANDIDADLIVMTSHGYTGIRRLILGSVTTGTICDADRPVLVVPTK
ncbi:MAG: universal stress protein [Chloroflexota bacterium]